jgi:hypothetical protein
MVAVMVEGTIFTKQLFSSINGRPYAASVPSFGRQVGRYPAADNSDD